jgi:geranylgeranyl diphosphate synthase type I
MGFESTLEKYKKIIDAELELFFKEKLKGANGDAKLNYSLIKEFVLGGGKRLRPIALLMAYNAVGGDEEKQIYRPSVSVELLHNSTLVHDDIMDEDDLRRGKATLHRKSKERFLENCAAGKNAPHSLFNSIPSRFGASNAILCGDVLIALGYSALLEARSKRLKEALRVYTNAYITIAEGQIIDIASSFRGAATESSYLELISKKTAALFKASVEIGAILGGGSARQIKSLGSYALKTAIAFQIKDDIMDISAGSRKGRELGSDIKKGKKTLLVIKALETATEREKKLISRILGKENASVSEINSFINMLHSSGAVEYAEKVAKEKVELAKQHLRAAGIEKKHRAFFEKLADYSVEREV